MPAAWRLMTAADLPQVEAIGDVVHPTYPEDAAVLAERLGLCPRGCHVLADAQSVHGYAVSHPWNDLRPPPLNHLLGALPDLPSCTYIHDVALLGTIRGRGAGRRIVDCLIAATGGLPVCLVAVGRSVPFWTRLGFVPAGDDLTDAMLKSYGTSAVYMRRI